MGNIVTTGHSGLTISRSRPRVAVISIHPAPYRDPTFVAVSQRRVVDLQVLTMFEYDAGHPYQGVGERAYPNTFLGKSFRIRGNSYLHPQILPLLASGHFDAVVVPGYNHVTSLLAVMYCLLTQTPMIFNTDGVLFTPNSTINRPSRDRLMRFILKHSRAVWVPGKASRAYMQHYGIPENKIFEGGYCLDCEYLMSLVESSRASRVHIRKKIGIGPDDLVFLFVGRMIRERGLTYLVDAFREVSDVYGKATLLLVGCGPERRLLERFVADNHLANVHILDPMPIEEICAYYAASDIYVLPSVSETYSLALAHAAIAALPMIATDRVGAVPDYVLDGETGFVVPAADKSALAQAMLRMCSSGLSMAMEMGRRARETALRRTPQWAAEQLEAAVIAAIDGKKM